MKKKYLFKVSLVFLFFLLIILPSKNSYCDEYIKGEIVSSVSQNQLSLLVGDKAVVSLGMKDGVIKGDLLKITDNTDVGLINPIGQCAVLRVNNDNSICEIIKLQTEIDAGSPVFMEKLKYTEEKYSPIIYGLLSKTVNPYEPHKRVKVFIYNIFDEKNDVTKFSMKLKKEIESIFSQKSKIILKGALKTKDFLFYPSVYKEYKGMLDEFMKIENIDVFITGTYVLENDKVKISLYKFDKYFGDIRTTLQIPLDKELTEVSEVFITYKPIKKEYVPCKFVYKEYQYIPHKDEKIDIVKYEANKDAFREYELKRVNFNIINPVDTTVMVDNEKLKFDAKNETLLSLTKGTHKILASFKRGYFLNTKDIPIYVSVKDIKKEIMLNIEREGNFVVEIDLNPFFEKDNIMFKIYKEKEKVFYLLKPVILIESDKPIESFKY